MSMTTFGDSLGAFDEWREHVFGVMNRFISWYEEEQGADLDLLSLYETLAQVQKDKLTISLVGEYSRGKSELINAIFFADYNARLLPSSPGRTTMCPSELAWDEDTEPCIRLLPIETRKVGKSISQLKKDRTAWTTVRLDVDDPDAMAEALGEMVKTKEVSCEEAEKLGLPLSDFLDEDNPNSDTVVIPHWRHAQINYPHGLLKQGLVLIDTPGLNALGSEPELTLRILRNSQAVVFVLGADTGVTRSDMEIWKQHVCVATGSTPKARIVALNKIDTLSNELTDADQVAAQIEKQIAETAEILNLPAENIYPVSAVKGLLGRVRGDEEMVAESGLEALERKLGTDIVADKQEILLEKVAAEIGVLAVSAQRSINTKIEHRQNELDELESLKGESDDTMRLAVEKLRDEKQRFDETVRSFNATQKILNQEVANFHQLMDPKSHKSAFDKTREGMKSSMTTRSLKGAMSELFRHLGSSLKRAETQSDKVRGLVENSYAMFHAKHGLQRLSPERFPVKMYVNRLQDILNDAEEYRTSTELLVTEKNYLVQKFFITVVSRMQNVMEDCSKAAKTWAVSVMGPIRDEIDNHRKQLERRLVNLRDMRDAKIDTETKVTSIRKQIEALTEDLKLIDETVTTVARGREQELLDAADVLGETQVPGINDVDEEDEAAGEPEPLVLSLAD